MTKYFIKDMVCYLPSQVVPGIVGLVSIPIFTRLFPPIDYGNYNLVLTTVMILNILIGWLPVSITRFHPGYERENKLDYFYMNILNLTFISILTITILFLFFFFLVRPSISLEVCSLMYIGLGVFIVASIFNVFLYFLRIKRLVNWFSGFTVWKSIGSLGIALLLIFFLKIGIESLLWGIILSILTILPILWKKTMEGRSTLYFKIDLCLTKEMLWYGFPLALSNIAIWMLDLSDRYFLAFFKGPHEVGIYSVNYYVAGHGILLIASLFALASGPILMQIWENQGEAKCKAFLNKITRYYLLICIPVIVILSTLSKPIINILADKRYVEGFKIIPYVSLGIFFFGLNDIFASSLLLYKKTKFITFAVVISGLLNLILNFLFIPIYGYTAAAIITLISYFILLLMMIIFSRRFFIWEFPFKSLSKIICASAIMAIIVFFVANKSSLFTLKYLILFIFFGGLIYLALLFLFEEIDPKEKIAMKDIFKKVYTSVSASLKYR